MNNKTGNLVHPRPPSPIQPVFERDLVRVKKFLTTDAAQPVSDSYCQALRQKLEQLATGDQGRRWYLPHRILIHVMDGSPIALQKARTDFLQEWAHGQDLDRRVHYWNSLQFRTGDRWICAAMLAQLLILWDWLAAAGVWTEAEIDSTASESLDVAEAYLEPHLKGRGHMPFLPDPINQTAACVCGLLYVGYIFGRKWRSEPRAQRMYALARNLLPDCIGQYPANGYDTDGFTYLRHIHLQVDTLSVALLEEAEGGDWYHRKFSPHNHSLADLNAMQLDFVMPSGYAWPLGRYGYIKSWNLFNQSFAARRTGDPRYLQVARRDNDTYDYKSPWLGMDLPLGLLWYPLELDDQISRDMKPSPQKRRVIEDSWAVFTNNADRMLGVMTWTLGKAPHFFLEAHGSPLILGGSESWPSSNGVQCEPDKWGANSWLTPGGKLLNYCDIPGLQAAYVDTTETYPGEVGVSRANRTFINCDMGLIISDRFASKSVSPVTWQAAVSAATTFHGSAATVRGIKGITLQAIATDGDWNLRPTPERKPRYEAMEELALAVLELQSPAGNAAFDVLLDWRQTPSTIKLHRERDDLLAIAEGAGHSMRILLPGAATAREIGAFTTDAMLGLLQADGALCLAGTRTASVGEDEIVWASLPVDVRIQSDAVWISGLKYGEFATLRGPDHYICVRTGNAVEVWGRSPRPIRLHICHSAASGQLNGQPVDLPNHDGWVCIDIPDTSSQAASAREAMKSAIKSGSTPQLIHALHEVQQAMAWECADEVRQLLKWDGSREPTLVAGSPKTEATYVRLEAAAAVACLGDRFAIPQLIKLLLDEAHRNYGSSSTGIGDAKWWGFPTRNVTLESLMLLHATSMLSILDEVLSLEVWPHGIDAVARARAVLGQAT